MTASNFEKIQKIFKLHNHRPRVFTWPFFGTIIFSGIMFAGYKLNQYITIWDKYKQAGGNATEFCELNRFDQLIVQPSNTWSNIGFIIAALIVLSIAKNDSKYYERSSVNNLLARFPGFSFLFGFSLLYLGLGSFLYHASLTHFFQKLDQTGMYFIVISAIAYNTYKLFPIIRLKNKHISSHKFLIWSAITVMAAFYLYLWKLPINIIFPSLILIFFFLNLYVQTKIEHSKPIKSFLTAAFVTIVFSYAIWILDRTTVLCSPTSPFQGHALWHILNSVCILLVYLYYRSEDYLPEEIQNEDIYETV
ncbi:MAG TPA: ceramidase domain-containing protein [Chitinophagales bacterium]|nr:ceramidase [Chitinophagales bacterium]MCB9075764.1 ceramidase domain-containing protein [Chitinophagales bacterium]HMU98718.1 ceramidase domain-containing protein [Chitinophagales bacterium]HMV03179.1 ceramidase domain-containing protein [Chitinophagales bacterium]HMW94326.1 ceramidase domain-containing protein [Chitinophagales bacterium]